MSFRIQSILLPLVSIYRVRIRGSESCKGPYQLSSLNPLVLKGRKLIGPESQIIRPGLLWTGDQEEGHGRMRLGEKERPAAPHVEESGNRDTQKDG